MNNIPPKKFPFIETIPEINAEEYNDANNEMAYLLGMICAGNRFIAVAGFVWVFEAGAIARGYVWMGLLCVVLGLLLCSKKITIFMLEL